MLFYLAVPSPNVTINSAPDGAPHYTGFQFSLECSSEIAQAVDTDVTVNHTWYKARTLHYSWTKIQNNSRVSPLPVFQENHGFTSYLQFSPLQKQDDYYYSCKSTVYPSPGDPKYEYLVESDRDSAKVPFDLSPRKLSNMDHI